MEKVFQKSKNLLLRCLAACFLCLIATTIYAQTCTQGKLSNCSNREICFNATAFNSKGILSWKSDITNQNFVKEAKKRELPCGVVSRVKAEICNAENTSNCSDLQICINATPKSTTWIKRKWASTQRSKPYRIEAKRRNLSCNVGGLQKTPLTNENIRKIGQKNPTYEFATDWRGLKGRWDGSIQCRGRKFDLTFQVDGAFAELQTAKYVYKGKVTYSADRRKAFVKASRDDGKKFNEIFELSKDFTSVSGVTSAGCEFSASNPKPIALGNKPVTQKKETYLEKCRLTSDGLKDAQRLLKQLGLYPYQIDGIAGKGTLSGIKKAKELVGSTASKGDCISASDIKAFQTLTANTLCTKDKLDQCSDQLLCERATERSNLLVSWIDNEYAAQAKSRGLDCNVTLVCNSRNIEVCTDEAVCEKATILRSGVRSWNFEEDAFIDRAKDLSLDCKLTIDNTPFSKKEAVYYLSQLVDFVTENAGDFDLNFASEFDKVRPITQGEWSTALSKDFELFRVYIAKFPSFQKHLEELRLANDAANQKRIEQLRGALTQDMTILKEWAKANVLDAKAAEIASLDANVGSKSFQDVNALEQLVAETQRLMSATGIVDGPVRKVTQEVVDSLYDPSSVYLFVNTSGNAANIYKNLDGEFTFEQNRGTLCPTEKLGDFDYYLLLERLLETYEGLFSVEQDCSKATDVFVVKGNELTTDQVFDVIPLSDLTQVSEFSKADRDKAYDQLAFLKETIQKDVLDGNRVGFGILKTDQIASKVCAIIDGEEYGHDDQLGQHALLMNALNLQWNGFEKVTSSSEEAFKFLQRGQCDAIYAGSLNLGRLYLAGDIAGVSLEFLPIWISKASVEASQQAYDDSIAASAQAEQNLEDQAKLDEQAKQSAAELAAVRQRELREQNGLRFMVLKDELQEQVFAASEFGFNNPPEKASYIKRYLAQPFVDQTTRYSPFDGIIGDMQILAAERWEITEQRLDQIDYGEASFNGRSVDALQVELKIASKNRLVGKYSEYCRRIHAIKDEDFEMWRNISVTDCSNETATSRWKLENAFRSKWIVAQLSDTEVVSNENIEAAKMVTSIPIVKDQSKRKNNSTKDNANTQQLNTNAFDEISKSGSNFQKYTFGEPLILANTIKLRVQSQEQIGLRPTFYDEAGNVIWVEISETSKKRFANFQIDCRENTCAAEGKLAIGLAYGVPDLVFHFEDYSKNLDDATIVGSIATLLEQNVPIKISVQGFPIYSDDVTHLTLTNDLKRLSSPRMIISLKNFDDQMLKEFVDICLNECTTLQFTGLWYPAGLAAEAYTYTK